ncbi:hypothetical protein NLJ89_g9274 [Agrocybe chaxingu]|uniref:Uncharacterized protein n=1 Tax=Agrocybe chaxingu TaxID=84603 RepID=A0A9W8JR39_9AGAR|nr:hypothetical protein NLJ89_g9274 [Agrocybe chaxingu]
MTTTRFMRIKAFLFLYKCFVSVTLYDAVCQAVERPTIGIPSLIKKLSYLYRRDLEVLVPMVLWNIYSQRIASATWGISLIFIIRQNFLEEVDEDILIERIDALGPVAFALSCFLPTLATRVYYCTQIMAASLSPAVGVLQILFVLLPGVLGFLAKVKQVYKGLMETPGCAAISELQLREFTDVSTDWQSLQQDCNSTE